MLLYDYFRSSAATRVRIALNLKGLSAERSYVHLVKGEQRAAGYLALNPQGFVPMLVVGDRRFTQSIAIIEYLDEKHSQPPLLPQGPEDRAWVRSIALAVACDIHPLNNTRVMKHLETTLGLSKGRARPGTTIGCAKDSRRSSPCSRPMPAAPSAMGTPRPWPTSASFPRSSTPSASGCRSSPTPASGRSTTPAWLCPPSPRRTPCASRTPNDSA